MVRAGRWLVGGPVVVLFAAEWWLVASGSAWASVPWFVLLGAAAVQLGVRFVRSRRGTARAWGDGAGEPLLGEVEDIALGRRTAPPVAYASDEGPVGEETLVRPDPLENPVWVVGPSEQPRT